MDLVVSSLTIPSNCSPWIQQGTRKASPLNNHHSTTDSDMQPHPASTGLDSDNATLEHAEIDAASIAWSEPFVGRWQQLVSQTNWEKGKIIYEWRLALVAQEAPATSYSDEAWAKQVGGVTSQHVGRLRRVYERFADSYASYEGLYWSHFLAALDWDDAELWLEGGARSGWSVSEMRRTRLQAMGGDPTTIDPNAPREDVELDDGFVELEPESSKLDDSERADRDFEDASGPVFEGPDFGEDGDDDASSDRSSTNSQFEIDGLSTVMAGGTNPFLELGDLPADVADAMEQFKLCIIRHRASNWSDMSQTKMLQILDALRQFADR